MYNTVKSSNHYLASFKDAPDRITGKWQIPINYLISVYVKHSWLKNLDIPKNYLSSV
jgi:hypothetical protein